MKKMIICLYNNHFRVYYRRLRRGLYLSGGLPIERISKSGTGDQGDSDCLQSSMSGDVRYVAFESRATTFVSGDTNAVGDIYVAPNE